VFYQPGNIPRRKIITMKKAMKAARRAFTLIELIITIVIIGILAAIALVGYQAVVDNAEERVGETTLQSVDREYRALDAFNAGTGVNGVDVLDMSQVANVTFVDADGTEHTFAPDGSVTSGDGTLSTGDMVTYSKDGVDVALRLGTATAPGALGTWDGTTFTAK
jgi:prepilin-type N-terminal cleavage/methylation domain-containing protein